VTREASDKLRALRREVADCAERTRSLRPPRRFLAQAEPDRRLRCSAEYWETRHHPYPAAYARLRQAEALLYEKSRSREAADAPTRAYLAARDLSAGPLVAQIERFAMRARVRFDPPASPSLPDRGKRSPAADGPQLLTGRERDVLAEVATGCSNREIGRRLCISDRTVGVHVSPILAKLHARTRAEATALYLRSRHDGSRPGPS
jgi:DNA-binding CsgD family transcriptional regulator